MTLFLLSSETRSDVLRLVQPLEIGIWDTFAVSAILCNQIEASISAYLSEESDRTALFDWVVQLRSLAQLLLADAPSIGLIRTCVARLPAPLIRQIEFRAFRLAAQVPACVNVGSDLVGWAQVAPATDLIPVFCLCIVEGVAMVPDQMRPTGRQSAPHFEPVVFGRGQGISWLPKLQGGRPADDAEVRLIAHLAVDWLESTSLEPEAGRDGNSAFGGLVYSVFGWLDIEAKAEHCLRQYWAMTKVKRPTRW